MVHPSAVAQLDFEGGGVILADRKVDFVLWDDLPGLIQSQGQRRCCVAPAAVLLADAVANVARSLPQGVV